MRKLVKVIRVGFASTQSIPLTLSFPYEYTLAPEEFSFQDIRFKELPFSRQFAKPEREHILHTLQLFEGVLNTGKLKDGQYIQKSLISKAEDVRSILAESKISLEFKLKGESVVKSQGYLEIKPKGDISLQEKDLKHIHHYLFERERQTLTVALKPQRQTLTAEEQLKKDISEKMGENSKEFREKLDNMRFSKHAMFANRFITKLMSIGKPDSKKKFESYFIIDQIQGKMECRMTYEGRAFSGEVPFDSKWLYWVGNLQSEDLKRHRKRTLFDFQYWNRGNFFPIRNYAGEIAHLE